MRKMQVIGMQNAKLKSELECQISNMHLLVQESENLKEEVASQRKELEQRANELQKRESQLDNERTSFYLEKEKVLPHILESNSVIGLKRMGEVVQKPFQDVCMQRFSAQDWELRSVELSSLWQDKVNNPNWHPFKQAVKDGECRVFAG
ncbi:hypothetical protein HanHA300_Chr00c0849g0817311 [Helianthus annuus]|nr:hypothetical protein HanHA300_Chr00c0849g0817311 [Helianthus annuus]